MKKYLILLLSSLLFLSCNDKNNNSSENTIKSESSILKIANESRDDISTVYTNYKEGISVAQKENKAIFILFSTSYCRWCTKLKENTLKNPEIINRLNKEYIVLFLNRDNDNYPKKYKVKGVPAVYLTDKNEEVFTKIVGYHKNPKDYLKWFNYIKIELESAKEH